MALLLENFLRDLRYAFRSYRRTPGLALTAIMAIMLGVGACTAVFSVVDAILFRPLAYGNPQQLVSFGFSAPIIQQEFMLGTAYEEWKRSQTVFSSMAAWALDSNACDLTERRPERLACADVERTLLPTLQVSPIMGRNFTDEEDRPNGPRVVLISHALWRSRFAADPKIVGKTLSLDGQPTEIIGVLPADFAIPAMPAEILRPLALDLARQMPPNTGRVLRAIGRLAPGVTAAQASAAIQLQADRERWVPAQFRREVTFRVRSVRDREVGDYRLASLALLFAVIAVLLIACANVANLLLARGLARERETAVRSALGASRKRLAMQTLTEALLLAMVGGVAGCALSYALLRIFLAIAPASIPRLAAVHWDVRVLLFALAATLISALLFALAPMLRSPKREIMAGGHAVTAKSGGLRPALAAFQIAGSVLLISVAALLLRTLWTLESTPLGIDTSSVITATFTLGHYEYPTPEKRLAFDEALEQRLRAIPGVEAVSFSDTLPPGGFEHSRPYSAMQPEGRAPYTSGTGGMIDSRSVTPDYFRALGIPIAAGRSFTESDRGPEEHAMIVNQALAKKIFGETSALGQRIKFVDGPAWYTIVGVATNAKNAGIASDAEPEYYLVRRHVAEDIGADTSIAVRSALSSTLMAHWLRREIAAIDPTLPVETATMDQRVSSLLARPRFNAVLLSLFGGIALLLAMIGLYGVMSFLVSERTQEIGVRMALGATPSRIIALVFSHAARWMLAGIIIGVAASLAAERLLRNLLFGVAPNQAETLGVTILVLCFTATLSAVIPAWRAARVDPMLALRHE
ncbi:MAG TPA: ABC transporter permease [Terriglobales bacterium]|nr:ABC transporter permease [Terriglobales bacterium]